MVEMKNKKKFKLAIPGIALFDILLYIFFSVATENFFSMYNTVLILRNSCTLIIASLAMTMAIMVSQIDMSIGSVISTAAVMIALMVNKGIPVFVAILAAVAMGAAVGAVNGLLIAKFRFDFWVVTFSTMSIMAGVALIICGGETVGFTNEFLDWVGNATLPGGIYWVIIITVIITAFMIWVERRTKFGYNMFSIGGSEVVAQNSGINVTLNRFKVYLFSGILAAITGVIVAGMTAAGGPTVGSEYAFNSMAAVVIGGTPFVGGKGGMLGTVFGTILLKILASGLSMMGIEPTWQKAITGIIIVSLIIVDVLNENRKVKNGLRRVYHDVEE